MAIEQKYKLNNLPAETTYTRFYVDFTGKKRKDGSENPFEGLTNVQQKILAAIVAKDGRKLTYDYLIEHYGIWRGAIKPALDGLFDKKLIEQLGTSCYKITVPFKKNYLKLDDYLFQKLEFEDLETGETVYKKPTFNAVKITGLVKRGNSNKKNDGVFTSSQARIAAALNMAKSTAGDNVRSLITDGMMTAEKADEQHDKRNQGLSSYKIAPEILAVKHVKKKTAATVKPRKAPVPAPARLPVPAQVNDGSALRAKIEQHYYDLRNKAVEDAEEIKESALRDKTYNKLHKQIEKLKIENAIAVARGNSSEEIQRQRAELEERADERLAKLGISKADFEPRYSCTSCNDTGYDSGGKQCKCLKQFIKTLKNA